MKEKDNSLNELHVQLVHYKKSIKRLCVCVSVYPLRFFKTLNMKNY